MAGIPPAQGRSNPSWSISTLLESPVPFSVIRIMSEYDMTLVEDVWCRVADLPIEGRIEAIREGLKGCKMSKASPPVLVSEADDEDEDDEDGDDEDEDDEDGDDDDDDDDEDEDEDEEDYNKDGEDQEKDREGRRLKQVPDDCERDCKKPKLAEGVEFHGEA